MRKIVTDTMLKIAADRLAVYPFRKLQHKLKDLDFIKGSTAAQMKDLYEAIPVILRGNFPKIRSNIRVLFVEIFRIFSEYFANIFSFSPEIFSIFLAFFQKFSQNALIFLQKFVKIIF